MKPFYLLGILLFLSVSVYSQINTGGFHANFGVDADTKSSYKKYGPAPSSSSGDDWYALTGATGKGVIDTFNASYYKSKLQNNNNISFSQRMSQPLYSNVNGKLWLDAVYLRDFVSGPGKDSTAFSYGKNGVSPSQWDGAEKVVNKDYDIVDAFAHFRRDGATGHDSLWFFTGMSTIGNATGRSMDVELYNKSLTYNSTTKKFTTAGTASGHTLWLFDLAGNVIQTGDLLITIVYAAGQKPTVEIYLWVTKLAANTVNPALFNFGNGFLSANALALFGYAKIIPNSSTTMVGSGIMNSSSTTSADTTYSSPWGTLKVNGTWSQNYETKQFVELGLNLTKVGIDPASYSAVASQACSRLYQSVIFKSGNSNSGSSGNGDGGEEGNYDGNHENDDGGGNGSNGSSGLIDFAGPIDLSVPGLNYTIRTDTLRCNHPTGSLVVNSSSPVGYYSWSTTDGIIIGSNADSTIINVEKHGTYKMISSMAIGCPAYQTHNLVVLSDSTSPVATAGIGITPAGDVQLLGGDAILSNILTPFGGSQGLSWQWTGPNSFTSTQQNPLINIDWAWGAYYLTVTELRNGCKAMASLDCSFRANMGAMGDKDGPTVPGKTYLWNNTNAHKLYLVSDQQKNVSGSIAVYNANGQLVVQKNIPFAIGRNNIELPVQPANQVRIVSLYIGKQLIFVRKVLY